jgi:hypothetical protein
MWSLSCAKQTLISRLLACELLLGHLKGDRLCGLVAMVPWYRSTGPGSISVATRFSENWWVWNGVHSASWVQWSSKSCLESREYGRRELSRWPRDTLYPQKLTLTSSTSDGRSIGIVRSRTKATEFFFLFYLGNTCRLSTQHSIPEDWILHKHDCESLKRFNLTTLLSLSNSSWFLLVSL